MDYQNFWERWLALTTLSEVDRKRLISRLHEEVRSGAEVLGALAASQMGQLLDHAHFAGKAAYLTAVTPVVTLAALDGYLLSLIIQGKNPEKMDLVDEMNTAQLGKMWSDHYEKDQNKSYLDKMDSIITMMLSKIYELRVNQALSLYPEIIKLPYQVTEKLHDSIAWATFQGYILGVMESELTHG